MYGRAVRRARTTPGSQNLDRRRITLHAMPNPVIFSGATKSTWRFTKNGASLGTIYLFTTGGQGPVRAELVNPPNANVIMIGREGKVWLRQEEHDIDLATLRFKGINFANSTLPLLMLPHLTHAGARAQRRDGVQVHRALRLGPLPEGRESNPDQGRSERAPDRVAARAPHGRRRDPRPVDLQPADLTPRACFSLPEARPLTFVWRGIRRAGGLSPLLSSS